MTVPEPPAARFRMPAEWEPHAGTWLAWPHRRSDWPGKFAPIKWVYGEIVRTLARFEPVNVICRDAEQRAEARRVLALAHADPVNVHYHLCPNDRGWVRDNGPIFAKDTAGGRAVLDFGFTAWAKYPDWEVDDRIAGFVAGVRGLPAVRPTVRGHRVVLEGGSIDVNGAGVMLTTEECLLSDVQQRNPPFSRADYEAVFAEYLGCRKTIWLNRGIAGDDTHGHVDDLARFVGPRTVVTVVDRDASSPNHRPLADNLERLQSARDQDGQPLDIVELPMPRPLVFDDLVLPASYANFLIASTVVLVPTFNDPADREALGLLASVFPDRTVVGIHAVDLVWGFGTIHCLTRDQPARRFP